MHLDEISRHLFLALVTLFSAGMNAYVAVCSAGVEAFWGDPFACAV